MFNRRTDVICGNPAVAKKELRDMKERHLRSIKDAKPATDSKPPRIVTPLLEQGRDYVVRKKQLAEQAVKDQKMVEKIAREKSRAFTLPQRPALVSRFDAKAAKTESSRVYAENQRLLNRLETVKPSVCNQRLANEYDKSRQYMMNTSYTFRQQNPGRSGTSTPQLVSLILRERKQALHAPSLLDF